MSLKEWAYTRTIRINSGNIERLFMAADQLHELSLLNKCAEFLSQNITDENVIGIRKFAASYFCKQLEKTAFNYLM